MRGREVHVDGCFVKNSSICIQLHMKKQLCYYYKIIPRTTLPRHGIRTVVDLRQTVSRSPPTWYILKNNNRKDNTCFLYYLVHMYVQHLRTTHLVGFEMCKNESTLYHLHVPWNKE